MPAEYPKRPSSIVDASVEGRYPESWNLLKNVNHAAGELQKLWLGFLAFGAFLIATALSVTHVDIFLGKSVKLPLLSVELPLLNFFVIAPILFIIFHFYVLTKYRMLKAMLSMLKEHHADVLTKSGEGKTSYTLRVLEPHLSTGILFRGLVSRTSYTDIYNHPKMLGALLFISLGILPLFLLLVMQAKFMPYQSQYVTCLYRSLILIDLVMIFTALISLNKSVLSIRIALIVIFAIPIGISWHGMTLDVNNISNMSYWHNNMLWTSRLRPKNRDFVIDEILESGDTASRTNLTNRSFIGADLVYADMRGLFLNGANFSHANLKNARLDGSILVGADFTGTQLEGVSAEDANFRSSTFINTNISKSSLAGAKLRNSIILGTNLSNANLDGTDMRWITIIDSSLRNVRAIGSNLKNAALINNYMGNATFKGSDFKKANIAGSVWTHRDKKTETTEADQNKHNEAFYCFPSQRATTRTNNNPDIQTSNNLDDRKKFSLSFRKLNNDQFPDFTLTRFSKTSLDQNFYHQFKADKNNQMLSLDPTKKRSILGPKEIYRYLVKQKFSTSENPDQKDKEKEKNKIAKAISKIEKLSYLQTCQSAYQKSLIQNTKFDISVSRYISSFDNTNSCSPKFKSTKCVEKLVNFLCKVGTYSKMNSHVADSFIASGRLDDFEKTTGQILRI